MKKSVLFTIMLFSCGLAQAATTWYVRLDGGTPTQCTGTTNAAYSGSGSNQPCALNHPVWALGAPGTSALMKGGDTLVIDDTNHTTGGQAQYEIGYSMPNTVTGNCYPNWSYNCTMSPVPSGPSPANPTIIVGSSYSTGCGSKPQLWGTDGLYQIFDVTGASNVDMECIELTDHSNCGFRVGSPLCAENWNSGTLSGPWAQKGIYGGGGESNLTFKNMDVHGFATRGFMLGGVNGITFSYVNMDGNYMANWDGDVGESGTTSYNSGTILLDHVKNRFAGCSEAYPRSASFNTADYSNCTDENDNPPGYGDGVGMYNTGGNWVVTDSEFSHNTQDGLDILYHDGTGSITVQRSLFEGNNGNQIKVTSPSIDIENSVIIGNCNYLKTNNKVKNTDSFVSCRAGGDAAVMSSAQGGTYNIYNSTLYTEGSSAVLIVDRLGTCNGTEKYTFRNNIYEGNGNNNLYISQLGGNCANPPFDTDYSFTYNVGCPTSNGAHDKCNTNPGWVSSISQTASSNLPNVALQSSSPAIGAGLVIAGIPTLDYSGKDRGTSSWDIGALQYATSATAPTTNNTSTLKTSPPVIAITSPANQSTFTAGSNINILATASETNGTISMVYFYNGPTLLTTSTGYPYAFVWSNVPAGTYTLTAQANDVNGVSTTSAPVTVTVTSPVAPPVVAITSPANQSTFTGGSNITLTASASETNGIITSVSFYNGSTLLGTSIATPFSYTWNNAPAGTYTLTAQATDTKGVSTTSNPITVTLTAVPAVAITSPANQSSFTSGSNINITATASETNGTITQVSFYNGTAYLGTSNVSPYTYSWTNVPAGTYALTAQATDSGGVVTTSTAINITVNSNTSTDTTTTPNTTSPPVTPSISTSSSAPTVSITSPFNQRTFITGSNINITANVLETGEDIAEVDFYYNGTNFLGMTNISPYTYSWTNVPAGTYALTVQATDTNGVSTTSDPVTITVTPRRRNHHWRD